MNTHIGSQYRRDIDGLRALAILLVIGFHAFPRRITGGFVGVDIFFVISGFLISGIIFDDLERGVFRFRNFYDRRIRRIIPALLLVLFSVIVAGWFVLSPVEYSLLAKQVLGSTAFAANFVLWTQSGYFQEAADAKPLLHLWSLGIEEQFYMLFPLLAVATYRRSMMMPIFVLLVASFSLNIYFMERSQEAAFYLPFSRFWELLAGVELAMWRRQRPQQHIAAIAGTIGSAVGAVLVLVPAFLLNSSAHFPGWWAILPVFGAVLIIGAGEQAWFNRFILASRPMVFCGLISYPLYLWHWPILSFMRIRKMGDDPSSVVKAAAMLGAVLLAYLTYRFIEKPIRGLRQISHKKIVVRGLMTVLAASAGLGAVILGCGGFPSRFPGELAAIASHDYKTEASVGMREGSCFLFPEQTQADFATDCAPREAAAGKRRVFIWGDSYAADLYPGLYSELDRRKFQITQYTSSACAPILNVDAPDRPHCRQINDFTYKKIAETRPDILIISANWDFAQMDARKIGDLRKTLTLLKDQNVKRVVVLGQVPLWHSKVVQILLHEGLSDPQHHILSVLGPVFYDRYNDDAIRDLASEVGAVYISPFDTLCSAVGCLVATGTQMGDVVTWDTGHFTPHGSRIFIRKVMRQVTGLSE